MNKRIIYILIGMFVLGGAIILYLDNNGNAQSKELLKEDFGIKLLPSYQTSTAVYDNVNLSLQAGMTNLQSMTMSSDGTKVYVLDATLDSITQYNLTSAWVISSGVYYANKSIVAQDNYATSIDFNSDGTKMYLTGSTGDKIYQYSLSTGWDLSTLSYDNVNVSTVTQDGAMVSGKFSSDGTKFYAFGFVGKRVFQYSLSPAWNLTNLTYVNKNYSVTQDSNMYEMFFESDGLTVHMAGYTNDKVYMYQMGTAWDISTAIFISNTSALTTQDSTPLSLFFKSDGSKLYVLGYATKKIYQYSLTVGDTTPPKYQNIGVNNTNPAILDYVLFSTNWTDNTALSSYTFGWNATGVNCDTWANDSVVTFNGVQNWSNVTKQIPATCLLANVPSIGIRIYANDSSNNWNETGIKLLFTGGGATCWTYNSVTKTLYVPSGCTYYQTGSGYV